MAGELGFVQVGVKVDGLNKLLRALEKLDDAAKQDFKDAGKQAGQIVADQAKIEVPVLTGRLQGSIKAGLTGRGAKVYAGRASVPYAGPIHFGWGRRNIYPNPFLYRAADKRIDEVVDRYLTEIYNVWNRTL